MGSIAIDSGNFESLLYFLGGLLTVWSLLMRSMFSLRVIYFVSTIVFILYGLLMRSPSVIVTSIIFSLINLVEIIRILLARRKKTLPPEFAAAYRLYSSLLDVETFLALMKIAEMKEYPPNSVILRENEEVAELHFILSGESDVFFKEEWITHLGAGDFIGEFSLLNGLPACATVKAIGECRTAVWKVKNCSDLENLFKMINFNVSKKLVRSNTPSLGEAFSSSKHFQSICQSGVKVKIPEGLFIQKGEQLSKLFFILSGKAAVKVKGERVATLGHGDFIGEFSLITGSSATADIYCMEAIEAVTWRKAEIEENRELYELVHANIARKLSDSMDSLFSEGALENMDFVKNARKKMFSDETIVKSGESIEEIFLLLGGEAELYKGEERVAGLKKGDLYGEESLYKSVSSPFTLFAKGDLEMAVWSVEEAKREGELLKVVELSSVNSLIDR